MHWASHNVNPILALRTAVCTDRWSEAWSQQERWRSEARQHRRQQHAVQRREDLQRRLKEHLVRLWIVGPRLAPEPKPTPPKGRTEGQKRWGRRTFSPKALHRKDAKM
jgi:hypothetical protein